MTTASNFCVRHIRDMYLVTDLLPFTHVIRISKSISDRLNTDS